VMLSRLTPTGYPRCKLHVNARERPDPPRRREPGAVPALGSGFI
jgi:hypothetical protein